MMRVRGIEPVTSALNFCYQKFIDAKELDSPLILSHVYLLLGMSMPLVFLSPGSGVVEDHYCEYIKNNGLVSEKLFESSYVSFLKYSEDFFGTQCCFYDMLTTNYAWKNYTLIYFSGILSVGIGDSFASIFGIMYGKTKWPSSNKTIVGTIAGISSQILAIAFMLYVGLLKDPHDSQNIATSFNQEGTSHIYFILQFTHLSRFVYWLGIVLTIIVVSLVEAFTDQVDNIVLPVMTFVGFSITHCFVRHFHC